MAFAFPSARCDWFRRPRLDDRASSCVVNPRSPSPPRGMSMLDVKPRSRSDLAREPRASRPRRDGRPRISVVTVASDESPAALREVAERASHWQRLGVEFVLVSVKRQIPGVSLSAIFNGARVVYGPADATLPQLRSLGL